MTIYVPHGNSVEKNRAMRAFGANLVEHGEDFQSAREEADRRAKLDGLEFVPSFHPDLVMGVATYALELLRQSRISTCSMFRSGRDRASAAASWRAICSG